MSAAEHQSLFAGQGSVGNPDLHAAILQRRRAERPLLEHPGEARPYGNEVAKWLLWRGLVWFGDAQFDAARVRRSAGYIEEQALRDAARAERQRRARR